MITEQTYNFKMVNKGLHPDIDVRPEIEVSVIALNELRAKAKAEWQNPCFKVHTRALSL